MNQSGLWSSTVTPLWTRMQKALRWRVRHIMIQSLFARAWFHRLTLRNTVFIGITGSAGKTTTKDLVVGIFSRLDLCHSTMLSRNEQKQAARTVLAVQKKHRYAVIEMSGAKPGEMDSAIKVVRPSIAALTVVGRDHYSAFRSVDAIATEKGKLIACLPPDGTAVLNIDDPLIRNIGENSHCRIIWVGSGEGATVRLLEASSVWPEPLTLTVEFKGETLTVKTQLHGTHLALPVLTALGIAIAAEVPLDRAIRLLRDIRPTIGRMQPVQDGQNIHFIRDDFKSPQWTLEAPLDFLGSARASRKVAVIGSISDSPWSPRKRYQRTALEARQVADLAVFVGRDAHHALRARSDEDDDTIQAFATVRDAAGYLDEILQSGDLVLLKGTNKADHIGRLFLNRMTPVRCWEDNCHVDDFCESCPRVFQQRMNHDKLAQKSGKDHKNIKDALLFKFGPLDSRAQIQLIIGLGNKGADRYWSRHNIGCRVVDYLAKSFGGVWDPVPEGLLSLVVLPGSNQVILFKPSAAINNCGDRIKRFVAQHGLSADNCLVVHDDIDLDFGSVRAKQAGGDGGHNGVRSIIGALGTSQFHRLRIGVRSADDQSKARQQVLKEFSTEQEKQMDRIFNLASQKTQQLVNSSMTETVVKNPAMS